MGTTVTISKMSLVTFKKIKKKALRARTNSEDEENDKDEMNKEDFDKTREIQKLRKRATGTNIETLGTRKRQANTEEDDDDPLNLKKGGMMDIKVMKNYKQKDDTFEVGVQYSKETHIRDEDDEMQRSIETEMSKMKGEKEKGTDEAQAVEKRYLTPENAALLALPEHLTKSTFKTDQQMISAQMLTGIPEVELGIDVKIQNIEKTEKAKKKLLEESRKKKMDLDTANDFVQHNRWKDIKEIEMIKNKLEK